MTLPQSLTSVALPTKPSNFEPETTTFAFLNEHFPFQIFYIYYTTVFIESQIFHS